MFGCIYSNRRWFNFLLFFIYHGLAKKDLPGKGSPGGFGASPSRFRLELFGQIFIFFWFFPSRAGFFWGQSYMYHDTLQKKNKTRRILQTDRRVSTPGRVDTLSRLFDYRAVRGQVFGSERARNLVN